MKLPDWHGWKWSNFHCPHYKLKIKKWQYRTLLVGCGAVVFLVHFYSPEVEPHSAFLLAVLTALDPTV